MLIRRCVLRGALMVTFVQAMVALNIPRTLWSEESECNVNFDQKESEPVDLSYMFTDAELLILAKGTNSPEYIPGLKALLGPFISLHVCRTLSVHKINKTSLKLFRIEGRAKKKQFSAAHGSLELGKIYPMDFRVVADPMVKLSSSLVLTGLELRFLEYNTTVSSGNYIGYNLAILTDLEVIYMVTMELKGTIVKTTLHLEVSGAGTMEFSDSTNCDIVDKREDLNLGRMCGPHVLDEVVKWRGLEAHIIHFLKPVLFQTIWCSFKNIMPQLVELTTAYAVLLSK